MWKLEGHNDQVCAVAFSTDGRTASSESSDKTIRIWNLATGTETLQLEGHESCVNAVAFSPNGKMIASGAEVGGSYYGTQQQVKRE